MLQQGTSHSLDLEEEAHEDGGSCIKINEKKNVHCVQCSFHWLCFPHNVRWFIGLVVCFQLECFPRLREETERIVTSHIRDRESRAKDQVPLVKLCLWARTNFWGIFFLIWRSVQKKIPLTCGKTEYARVYTHNISQCGRCKDTTSTC